MVPGVDRAADPVEDPAATVVVPGAAIAVAAAMEAAAVAAASVAAETAVRKIWKI